MAIMNGHRGTEAQRRIFDLCVSVPLWLMAVLVVATMVSVAAQIRPTPQPPRRPSAPPRTAPPPKKAPAEPDDDRGGKEAAPPPAATTRQSAAADTTPAGTGAALYK
jgi:hypothetical protein